VALASLAGVVLNIHRRRACFAIWAVTNASWTVVDLYHGVWAQACLQAVYVGLSFYGLWHWKRTGKEQQG
jgi:nicotinamide riboside transporter PnuC